MQKYEIHADVNCLYFVSSECRTWIPAKTIMVFAPNETAASVTRLSRFAQASGWVDIAEEEGAVLILPISEKGWQKESTSLIKPLYKTVWRDTCSPDPRESLRNVWCWETLIFAVGYAEGAVFAGNAAVNHPNAFAQVSLVGGIPSDYSGGERLSDRWLLPDASDDWMVKNKNVPVSVHMLGSCETEEAERYFRKESDPDLVVTTPGNWGADRETTGKIMDQFRTRIRWKNSPDGTPARLKPKALMDTDGEYILDFVDHGENRYEFYTRLPKGGGKGLPVVVCMHGHGEPAWMFAQKNGWPELQDETGGFVFVSPDSPEHTWLIERDEGMHEKMLCKLEALYGIDRTRVYLTGFSNGSMATCWYGTRHPQLYAALAPWNSPLLSFEEDLLRDGWEMPMFAINGDLDHKMDVPRRSYPELFRRFISLNGGIPRKAEIPKPWPWKCDEKWDASNRYLPEAGYAQGDRLTTYVYNNLEGQPRFCFTVVKDMPHGTIHDEARATWEFCKRFSRPAGSKKVVDSQPPETEAHLETRVLPGGDQLILYISSSANSYTPARSIVLIPEGEKASNVDAIKRWLVSSGWMRQSNKDGSVLLIPVSGGTWKDKPEHLIVDIYQSAWGKTPSREPDNITWRLSPTGVKWGNVWMWEVLWHIVGYGDGAVLAGNCAAWYPNRFASVTLIGGAPDHFPGPEVKSDHFVVSKMGKNPDRMKGVSEDYDGRVAEIPSAVWMINAEDAEAAVSYFCHADGIPGDTAAAAVRMAGTPATAYVNLQEEAQRVILSRLDTVPSPQQLMSDWIGPAVRWKNGPDGTLKTFFWKDQIESGESPYEKQSFRVPCEDRDRDYYVYRPKNLPPKAPVVITIHGHGEPAWMFISKNGWPQLADREGILIVSPQDNSENRWHGETDNESFVYLVEDICDCYDVDPERIYISGFSNGNMQCYGAASRHPELFAAMWPMSRAAGGSMFPLEEGQLPDLEHLKQHGLEMPMFGVTGDNDGWIVEHPEQADSSISETIAVFLKLAGTEPRKASSPAPMYWQPDEYRGEEWYRQKYGFKEADRFETWVYHNADHQPRVCITVMKNMPHGTIWEETAAAWDFMKQFRRKPDGKIEMI